MKPEIIASYDPGIHNANMDASITRIRNAAQWKKLDTIWLTPAGGSIPTKVVASWLNVYAPPNNKLFRMFAMGCEVGDAFSTAIENILDHPDLSKFKYVFTCEHDMVIPPDCLVKLLEDMENHPEFAWISALYWTRGDLGCAQIWGRPDTTSLSFEPQLPVPGKIVECAGTGMGACVFRLDMFKDTRLKRPWFRTKGRINDPEPGQGVSTQDLSFAADAHQYGYRCAVDCRIECGHFDIESGITY